MKKINAICFVVMMSGQAISAPTPEFTAEKICKAAVSTIMGKDPSIIKVTQIHPGEFDLRYNRPSDDSLWGFGCKLIGNNQVMWRSGAEPDNPGYIGRWRTDPADGKITYSITAGKLTINDSISGERTFTKKEL